MLPDDCLNVIHQYCGDKPFILFSSTCKGLWNRFNSNFNLKFTWVHTKISVTPDQTDFIPINSFNTKILCVYNSYLQANNYFHHTYDNKHVERPSNIIRLVSSDDLNRNTNSYEYSIYSLQYALEFK
jgi:hypothetical protein